MLNVLDKLVCSHDSAVIFTLGSRCSEVGENDDILLAENNVISKVGNVLCDFAVLDSLYNSLAVDKLASCEVDEAYSVLHHSDLLSVDSVLCLGSVRHMDSDVVALLVDNVDIVNYSYVRIEVDSCVY